MNNEITISPYNPDWPNQFDEETHKNKVALGVNCSAIHHIGSTSVQDLAAKPIIDIIPVVKDLSQVDNENDKMQALGYVVKGEFGFLLRRFFVKEDQFHVHVFEEKNTEIERHLNFRNWLRHHPVDRKSWLYEDSSG